MLRTGGSRTVKTDKKNYTRNEGIDDKMVVGGSKAIDHSHF
jgi:hypothetical protein